MTRSLERQAKRAADEFRADHRLGVQPLGDLVALIEQTTGHDVAILDADADEHGLLMRDPDRGAVFIGVARTRNPMRQRSTLAHELGHLIFGDWVEDFGVRSMEESRADDFARHLLIPVEGVGEFLGSRGDVTDADLSDVVQRFLVSPAIAAIAIRDAGYIPQTVAEQWMTSYTPALATRFGWRDHYGALQDDSDRPRAPQRLVARAVAGYSAGVVTARQIAAVRGLPVDVVVEELTDAGVVPVDHHPEDVAAEDLADIDVDLSDLVDDDASQS